MRHATRVFVFASSYFVVTACGSEERSSLKEMTPQNTIVLAAMGGNTSCGTGDDGQPSPYPMSFYGNFKDVVDRTAIARDQAVRWLVSCHTGESTLHYAISDDPSTVHHVAIDQTADIVRALAGDDGKVFL